MRCTTLYVTPAPPPPPPPPPPTPALRVVDISAMPFRVEVGGSTDITVVVENASDVAGSAIVSVTVNGREIERLDTGTVEPGTTVALTRTWTPSETGTFEICAEVV